MAAGSRLSGPAESRARVVAICPAAPLPLLMLFSLRRVVPALSPSLTFGLLCAFAVASAQMRLEAATCLVLAAALCGVAAASDAIQVGAAGREPEVDAAAPRPVASAPAIVDAADPKPLPSCGQSPRLPALCCSGPTSAGHLCAASALGLPRTCIDCGGELA